MPFPAEIKLLVQLRRDGRVPRVQRAPGPVRDRVEVGVGLGGELGLAALDEGRARGGVDLFPVTRVKRERERRERERKVERSRLSFFLLSLFSELVSLRFFSPFSCVFRTSPTNSRFCWPRTGPGASRPAVS